MDLTPYISQLRDDLTSAASVGDEHTQQMAAVLASAIEPAARLAIMNALSDLAAEITTQLDGPVVDLRLDGRDVQVVVNDATTSRTEDTTNEPPPPPPHSEGGDISRITLRLLDEIKSQAEKAAASQGVSLNTWVAQAVQGALHGSRGRGPWDHGRGRWRGEPGARIHGWVQS